ncbi:oxidoreductase [Aureococcus anophagefferens]|nr:oxidoreductase [Aureococcus anophagefferens]
MNAAAEKWHQAGGNWFKIFKRLDTSGDGLMGFEEIEHIIRAIFPGLHITKKELSEENLRGLWKALDADRSGAISVQEFMIFMRRHGMHHETIPYIATKQQKDRLASEMSLDRLDIKFGFGLGKLRVLADKSKALPKRGPDINDRN